MICLINTLEKICSFLRSMWEWLLDALRISFFYVCMTAIAPIVILPLLWGCWILAYTQSPTELYGNTKNFRKDITPVCTYDIVNVYFHDPGAFTQGLVFDKGFLYEGTGLYGRSELRRTELETGKILQKIKLSNQLFGEGVTVLGNTVIQLTWKSHTGFVYDKNSFERIQAFRYPTEGWGLTHDGTNLIMSDGTSILYFLKPLTFQETGRIEVFDHRGPVTQLNELEYIKGEIYANVWNTDYIVRINPQTGRVIARIDMAGLLGSKDSGLPVDVLNGIAYDEYRDRIFVTGKLWPKLFEIAVKDEK
ncbi:glutaminyl-peptide cyclotransferase [Desulfobacterales bacterium HSG16]|nr:glutaminyl-peptide cyclotransferase [Desulfobacterales bacterium HSG16]